ncbi:relaxase/mobilization nuclease domain-containing protein [Bradyrhizobium sp. CCGUVB4N]|uniref:relaxase/mobilization nuclease domain-containing protein n=1 Tax=Bradyrhizobium sp. CCGUVB4N TaxID=2949631 RepID=UPI0020B3F2E3|nr:relaxase/mobilization nuclease domain-containing protein [Bradyrhizobium sp. CCGUVB4N]MCP3381257.1 relaxase/mobilization nuclease domain-containing protein [Bradyrhizobium sp. CCGUVB4N]
MIVKISDSGSSFKGLATYLTHDPKAQTAERVAWTQTHGLANDYVPAAVNEMYITAESAEWLKEQAGVRAGGRPVENPVKHISLNWAEEDKPSREHMIKTGEDYLRHMGWSDHQVIMVAHSDKPYAHLHMIINAIHPETGKALDDGFEKRRSQTWALKYELEQNRVHCTERLKNVGEREQTMPRNIWMEFKPNEREFRKSERQFLQNPEIEEYRPENRRATEWEIFKQFQRDERDQFIAEGKSKFKQLRSEIYREVHADFRERWAEYYKAEKKGTENAPAQLAAVKAKIVADEKAALEPRREAGFKELRKERDVEREALNAQQREVRAEFRSRLESGMDNSDFFAGLAAKRDNRTAVRSTFREAGHETTSRPIDPVETPFVGKLIDARLEPISRAPWRPDTRKGQAREKDAGDVAKRRTMGAVGGVADGIFSFLTNLGSARPEPVPTKERADQFREAAENALKQEQQRGRETEDAAWRERQKVHTRE